MIKLPRLEIITNMGTIEAIKYDHHKPFDFGLL
jgi:hypothetical protein